MSVIDPTRRPQLVGAKPATNVVFRVYSPARPLADGEFYEPPANALLEDKQLVIRFRDFHVQVVDFAGDGSMVLRSQVKVGEVPDLRPEAKFGDKIEEWMQLIVAVIDPDQRLRAESIVLGPEPAEGPAGVN